MFDSGPSVFGLIIQIPRRLTQIHQHCILLANTIINKEFLSYIIFLYKNKILLTLKIINFPVFLQMYTPFEIMILSHIFLFLCLCFILCTCKNMLFAIYPLKHVSIITLLPRLLQNINLFLLFF